MSLWYLKLSVCRANGGVHSLSSGAGNSGALALCHYGRLDAVRGVRTVSRTKMPQRERNDETLRRDHVAAGPPPTMAGPNDLHLHFPASARHHNRCLILQLGGCARVCGISFGHRRRIDTSGREKGTGDGSMLRSQDSAIPRYGLSHAGQFHMSPEFRYHHASVTGSPHCCPRAICMNIQ